MAIGFYLSTQLLFQPDLFELWEPIDVFTAWLEYAAELAFIGVAIGLLFVLFENRISARGRSRWLWWPVFAAALYATCLVCTLAIAAASGSLRAAPPPDLVATQALRWTVLALGAIVLHALWRKALSIDAEASAAQREGGLLAREEHELQLRLLQAQIEPHFLFNTLANMRRLYRLEPEHGAQMMASLQRYLRAALPRERRTDSTLHDELLLVRAYLELLQVRMGARLGFRIGEAPAVGDAEMPPMVVVTLVENAIKHGLEPCADGGRVDVAALTDGAFLRVSVRDDGVGLLALDTQGSGVGLVNVRRQLLARFGPAAQLELKPLPRGVEATIVVPLRRLQGRAPAFAADRRVQPT